MVLFYYAKIHDRKIRCLVMCKNGGVVYEKIICKHSDIK